MPSVRTKQLGFSFMEVMVALAVLSISLIVLLESQAFSMKLVSKTRATDQATTLAMNKMADVTRFIEEKGIKALPKEEMGEFDSELYPGFRWRVYRMGIPAPDFAKMLTMTGGGSEEESEEEDSGNAALFAGPLKIITKIWAESVYELHVQVIWGEGRNERDFELVTHFIERTVGQQLQGTVRGLGGDFSDLTGGGTDG